MPTSHTYTHTYTHTHTHIHIHTHTHIHIYMPMPTSQERQASIHFLLYAHIFFLYIHNFFFLIYTHICAYADEPREASVNPLFVLDWPHVVVRGDEVLDLHLLEFAHESYSTYLLVQKYKYCRRRCFLSTCSNLRERKMKLRGVIS